MVLTPIIIQELTTALRERSGNELMAFILTGKSGYQELYRVRNPCSGGEFFLSEEEAGRVRQYAVRRNLAIAAFVHSHISSRSPSRADLESIDSNQSFPWIIVWLSGSGLEVSLVDGQLSIGTSH